MACSIFRVRGYAAFAGTLLLFVSSMVRSEVVVDDPLAVEVHQPRACLAACRELGSGFRLGACVYSCAISLLECHSESRDKRAQRRGQCRQNDDADTRSGCQGESSVGFKGCAVTLVPARQGLAPVPQLPAGTPADMSLLDPAERAVIEAADRRAAAVRNRELVLRVAGRRRVPVRIVQTHHAFGFGFPIDKRNFDGDPEGLAFFESITRDQFDLAVLSSNAKWARVEPVRFPDPEYNYDLVDADVEWAVEDNDFEVKGHTLMWGISPLITDSGVPPWLVGAYGVFPQPLLGEDRTFVRERLKAHVVGIMQRYDDVIATWDVTNETLQPLGKWFELAFAGEDIVSQMYQWAREAKPDATLVFNEWIDEVFTGLDVTEYGLPPVLGTAPTAADVRDRVIELLDQGVPIDVLGQQAHFAPAAAFAPEVLRELLGLEFDLDGRTQIDDYAVALDTLAETGLPIHITETNFIAPQDPELRAAHAEGLMRVWWGHPSVQRIVFWGPWNAVAGRREFDVGLWDDAGELSRHGEAVLSLINDRWRTDVTVTPHWRRAVRLEAVRGDYATQWSVKGEPVYATFSVARGDGARRVVLVEPRL